MNFHRKLYLEVDSLKNLVWCIEFQEEHDEDAMVGHLAYEITSDDFGKYSLDESIQRGQENIFIRIVNFMF